MCVKSWFLRANWLLFLGFIHFEYQHAHYNPVVKTLSYNANLSYASPLGSYPTNTIILGLFYSHTPWSLGLNGHFCLKQKNAQNEALQLVLGDLHPDSHSIPIYTCSYCSYVA